MDSNYKNIHIGNIIEDIVALKDIDRNRICNFFSCEDSYIDKMYASKSLDTDSLLRWCKLLDYNLFMYYHTHLQLYSPRSATAQVYDQETKPIGKYSFKKNYYSPFIKDFLLEMINDGRMTIAEIQNKYQIPKTTIYRWKKKTGLKSRDKINLETSDASQIDYFHLYTDYIKQSAFLSEEDKEMLIDKVKRISDFNDLVEISNCILDKCPTNYDRKDVQQLKSFDKNRILKILKDQKENNYTNVDLANKYQLSRNTIKRWRDCFAEEI
jgi:transposase-like protein